MHNPHRNGRESEGKVVLLQGCVVAAGDDSSESLDDLRRVFELSAVDVDPLEPVAAGEDCAAVVEGFGG